MAVSGKVEKWVPQKGCGFIKGDDGEEYFTHKDALIGGARLENGGRVTFDVERSRPRRDHHKVALRVSGPAVLPAVKGKSVGTVVEWYPARSYGFIAPSKFPNAKVYVHSSAFEGASLQISKAVFFDTVDVDHKTGRKVAINVSGGAVKQRGSCHCVVKKWIAEKGYGFVEDVETGDELFVHASVLGEGGYLEEGREIWCDTQVEERKGDKKSGYNITGPGVRDSQLDEPAGGYQAAPRAPMGGRGGGEKRADVDGNMYTRAEFVEHYGGSKQWDEREKRISPKNGQAYTKEKFMKHFGGLDEWKAAKKFVSGMETAPQYKSKSYGAKADTVVGRGGNRVSFGVQGRGGR